MKRMMIICHVIQESIPQLILIIFLPYDLKIEGLETNRFVLVHGGGFGAWCWYKTMTLLEESGYRVDAVDLTGSGVHSFDTNSITTLAQYVKPLTDILEKLGDGEKVFALSLSLSLSLSNSALSLFVFMYAYRVNIVNA
jgi:pimeloyl-ACP methyl ester carboxylesterase